MNVGILGGGNISDTHARAAAAIPGVTVVACHGTNRERTARLNLVGACLSTVCS